MRKDLKEIFNNNYLFLISFFTVLIIILCNDSTLHIKSEMWAEMATNYFYNSHYKSFGQGLLQDDFGYLPLICRLLADFLGLFKFDIKYIPYCYQAVSLFFICIFCSWPCLSFYSKIIKSNWLRFFLSIGIALNTNYELKTFINFIYYSAIPLSLYVLFFKEHQYLSYKKCLFLSLIFFISFCSKATFICYTPILIIIIFKSIKQKDKNNIILSSIGILGSLVQITYIFIYNNTHISALVLDKPTLKDYIIKTFNHVMSLFYAESLGTIIETKNKFFILILISMMCILLLLNLKNKKWRWMFGATALICLGSTLINIKVYNSMLSSALDLNFYYFKSRAWMIPSATLFILFFYYFQSVFNLDTKDKLNFKKIIFGFIFLKFNYVYSGFPLNKEDWPQVGFSDWNLYSQKIQNNDDFYCIPINPYPWILKKNCEVIKMPTYTEATFPNHSMQKPEPIKLPESYINTQYLGFLYKNITTYGHVFLEITQVDNTKIVLNPIAIQPHYMLFYSDKPILHIDIMELKGIQSISHQNKNILYFLMAHKN